MKVVWIQLANNLDSLWREATQANVYAHYGQQPPQRMCVLTASGENTENVQVKTLDTIVVLKTTVF